MYTNLKILVQQNLKPSAISFSIKCLSRYIYIDICAGFGFNTSVLDLSHAQLTNQIAELQVVYLP